MNTLPGKLKVLTGKENDKYQYSILHPETETSQIINFDNEVNDLIDIKISDFFDSDIDGKYLSSTGNAISATKLANARDINIADADSSHTGTKISFDGTNTTELKIKLPSTIKATIDGNASSATKLANARDINIVDADGTNTGTKISFDGTNTTELKIKLPSTIKATLSGTATKATQDGSGNVITTTYETKANAITNLSADGQIITYTKGDASTGTVTTQDKNVTQTKSTTNNTYPILAAATANQSSTTTAGSIFTTGIKINPSTNIISASAFSGNLSGTADKATNDSDNNPINTTYAKLGGATFTGAVTLASTPTANDNSLKAATTAYVDNAISALIGTAPETLNTLEEIADAINNDKDLYTTLTDAIGNKQNQHAALTSISGLTTAANKMIYTTAANTYATATLTEFARSILDDADAATVRSTIGALSTSGTAADSSKLGGSVAANYALLASPTFTGTPKAPTATSTSNDTQIATTAFVNTAVSNGHYTTKLIAGGSSSTANAAVTSGNVYLRLFDTDTHRNSIQLKPGSNVSITSDTNGVITFAATNTTYSDATTSAHGLMSTFDKSKLDGITESADAVSFTANLASGTKVGTITINGTGTDLYCQTNTDTHYTTKLIAGGSTATANAATTNGNTYLRLFDDSTARNSIKITGTGATSVTSDANGVITINSANTDTQVTNTLGTTTKAYITGTTSATTSTGTQIFDTGVYLSTTAGELVATKFTGNLTGNVTGNVSGTAANITGTVAIANGGTGLNSSPSMLTDLGSTTAANILAASPRPGVTGVLPLANGGTGTSSGLPITNVIASGSTAGSIDAITAFRLGETASNKTFGIAAQYITVEYSRDAGETWIDYGLTDDQKKSLFMELRTTTVYLGKASSKADNSINNRLRITINPAGRYVSVNMFYLWGSTQGNTWYATLDVQTYANADTDTWTNLFTDKQLSGWSGNNVVYFNQVAGFNRSSTQTANMYALRLTFKQTTANSSNYTSPCLQDIRFYGVNWWSSDHNIVSRNRFYTWDVNNNVTFPAGLTATNFTGTLTGNAASATKATNDSDNNQISTTYAKLSGAAFTGTVTATTAATGTKTTQVATTEFVDNAITNANKQDKHAALTSISGLTTAADNMIYATAANTYAVTSLTSTARSLLDDTSIAAMRTTLDVPSRTGSDASGSWGIDISGTAAIATNDSNGKKISEHTVEYIVGTQTAATGAWTGVTKDAALYAGKMIIYKLPYAGSGNATLNLTLSTGTKTGAKNVYRYASTRLTTQYGANYYIPLIYNGTYWFALADYDTNYYDRIRVANAFATASGDVATYKFVGSTDGNSYKELNAGTTFDIRYPVLYNVTAYADAAAMSTGLYWVFPGANLQTTLADTTRTFTEKAQVYLKGTLSGNIFTVHSDVLTTTVPTNADGYYYLYVGRTYSTYQANINVAYNQFWSYVNGAFQPVNLTALKAIQDGAGNTITSYYAKKPSIGTATLPTSGWTNNSSETSEYKYYYDITVSGITANDIAEIIIQRASIGSADTAGICTSNESMVNKIRIFSKNVPTAAINVEYHIHYAS